MKSVLKFSNQLSIKYHIRLGLHIKSKFQYTHILQQIDKLIHDWS